MSIPFQGKVIMIASQTPLPTRPFPLESSSTSAVFYVSVWPGVLSVLRGGLLSLALSRVKSLQHLFVCFLPQSTEQSPLAMLVNS